MTSRRGSATRRRRTTRRRRRAATTFRLSGRLVREVLALVLVFLAIISVIALFAPNAGAIIKPWHDVLASLLGWGIAFAGPLLIGFALMLWMKAMPAERWMAASGAAIVALGLLGVFELGGGGGGVLGASVSTVIGGAVGRVGAWIVLALSLAVGLLLYFNMTVGDVVAAYLQRREDRQELADAEARRNGNQERRARADGPEDVPEPPGSRLGLLRRMRGAFGAAEQDEPPLIVRRQRPESSSNGSRAAGQRPSGPSPVLGPLDDEAVVDLALESDEEAHLAEAGTVEAEHANDAALEAVQRVWNLPRLELLADAPESSAAQMDLTAKGQRIRETLANFKIGVKVARIQEGPVVTQYALDVEPGIKLSRIEGLADNLALALAARSIRIQAPIPGEPYVGIEIPNNAFDLVTLKEVLASKNFSEASSKSKLAFALGQDVAGSAVQRRPVEDAARADRRRDRVGQECVRQRDHLLAADECLTRPR